MPTMGRISPKAEKIVCGIHVKLIGQALIQYTTENNDTLPSKWCDALRSVQTFDTLYLRCGSARITFKEGESCYALNEYVVGKKLSELLPDTVILFETDCIGESPTKMIPMGQRGFANEDNLYAFAENKVREGAWNQVGGIDILTCSYHAGLGCNILFADGRVEFVKSEDIPNLRWTVEK
jgi:prepilin-type processing-associated H-X9-DG protein